ncbi:hypothetical protein JB92DRAFT_3027651 [Gautieria morchelliformis]|nr:hypothetical protein JB92DRAFT_3027651 [Gautieria morchelliformis]
MIPFALALVFRTWAIWGQDSRLAVRWLFVLSIMAISTCCLSLPWATVVSVVTSPNSRLIACWGFINTRNILFLDYIMIIAFESNTYRPREQ